MAGYIAIVQRLVSVNVGLPRDVPWQGRVVRTAIWKAPLQGRVMVRRLNIDGDGQGDRAGHGGEQRAVMVYQLASYQYWEAYLKRQDFAYGQFGENLTVDGLGDDEVCIGDRYRIGGALLEVTQPRVTCYRVGIRMNNPQMPALLVSQKRPGFYCRVIEEGEIGAGDTIEQVSAAPERVTVREIDGLLYLPNPSRDRLERAARIPALSPGWKTSLDALVTAAESGQQSGNAGLTAFAAPPPAWPGFRPLRVATARQETPDVSSFVLASEDHAPLPAPLAGQYVVLRLHPGPGSAPILRSYSLSDAPGLGTYRIAVKRDEGVGSRYVVDSTRTGGTLDVSAPRGEFTLAIGTDPIVMLSAGIGVTPLLAMLHALATDPAAAREVWWCYGARNSAEHPFADEVRGLLARMAGSHSFIAYSRPGPHDAVGTNCSAIGHLTLPLLKTFGIPQRAQFYLCGPPRFMTDLTTALLAWGVPRATIHQEVFGSEGAVTPGIAPSVHAAAPHQPAGAPGTGPLVSFTRTGLTVSWDPRFHSLLELAEACDVPVRWSCRTGVCHTCECGLVDGSLQYDPAPLEPPATGNALICCSTPSSAIDLDL